jgi:hypothetical protein
MKDSMACVRASMPVAAVIVWRQPGHQAGIERRHLRHQARIDDHQLGLPFRDPRSRRRR